MPDLHALEALGIDTAAGIAYCAEDEEFYQEMLEVFVSDAGEKGRALAQSFQSRDWEGYRITVHALKSAARMIGANALADLAQAQEHAAKSGEEAALCAGHGALTDAAEELCAALGRLLP